MASLRVAAWIGLGVVSAGLVGGPDQACAAAPAPAVSSPFDREDPEVAAIKALDWKNANFDALDARKRCGALLALNRALSNLGAKADARLELLTEYIDKNGLGAAYVSAAEAIPGPPEVTFETMKKVAAAYAVSPAGAARLGDEFAGAPEAMVQRYLALYERNSRREFEETAGSRAQVRSMGLFLQGQGKLEAFRTWAEQEMQRRQEAHQKKVSERQAEGKAEQAAQRQRVQAAADKRRQQREAEEAAAAAQLAAALQLQQEQAAAAEREQAANAPPSDGYWGWGGPWWGSTEVRYSSNAYYNGHAYRGQVMQRVDEAYDRWKQMGPAHLAVPAP